MSRKLQFLTGYISLERRNVCSLLLRFDTSLKYIQTQSSCISSGSSIRSWSLDGRYAPGIWSIFEASCRTGDVVGRRGNVRSLSLALLLRGWLLARLLALAHQSPDVYRLLLVVVIVVVAGVHDIEV
jgi:hypothetical protein